jgi:hypothetical protein
VQLAPILVLLSDRRRNIEEAVAVDCAQSPAACHLLQPERDVDDGIS